METVKENKEEKGNCDRWGERNEGEEEAIKMLARKYNALLLRGKPDCKTDIHEEYHVETEYLMRLKEPLHSIIEKHIPSDPIEYVHDGLLNKDIINIYLVLP